MSIFNKDLEVEHDAGRNKFFKSKLISLSKDGMEVLPVSEGMEKFKYFWLAFTLQDGKIKALGELEKGNGKKDSRTLKIKFKHLFPKDRLRIEKFINDVK